jgi:hypothetical protein
MRRKEIEDTIPYMEYSPTTEYLIYKDEVDILDSDFVSGNFMLDLTFVESETSDGNNKWYYKNVADMEWMSTDIGGHMAINPPNSFTRFADIPRKGLRTDTEEFMDNPLSSNLGMGRRWGDMFQHTMHTRLLYLEAGKPKFRSLFSYYMNAIDYGASVVANEGRWLGYYNVGKAVGTVAQFIAYPVFSAIYYITTEIIELLVGATDFRYYSFREDMHNYLSTVNNLYTSFLVERGIIKFKIDPSDSSPEKKYGFPISVEGQDLDDIKELLPEVFSSSKGIDLFRLVAKPQNILNKMVKAEKQILESGSGSIPQVDNPETKSLQDVYREVSNLKSMKAEVDDKGRPLVANKKLPEPDSSKDATELTKKDDKGMIERFIQDLDDWWKEFKKYYGIMGSFGFNNICLYVDYLGSSTITFNNEIKDIPAKQVLNSIGSASRDIKFSLSGGNVLGDVATEVLRAGRDVAMGTLEKVTFGLSNVIMALMGGGYLDFPKMWSDSSVTLPTYSFKIHAGSPSGDPLSLSVEIDLILSFLLALSLPQSIGNAGYTSPPLCRAYIRGLCNIDFGMVTSLTITTGNGKIGRNVEGVPLDAEISFTITDFSDIAVTPTNSGFLGSYHMNLQDYAPLERWIRTVGGRSYAGSRYISKEIRYRISSLLGSDGKLLQNEMLNPARMAGMFNDNIIGQVSRLFAVSDSAAVMFQ